MVAERTNGNRKNNEPLRYKELDSFRGIAALMVALFHFTMGRPEAELGFKLGTTGVDLFFIISGFVISMSIGKVNRGLDFVINRASRLYPTYWASVTLTFVLISLYGLYKDEPVRWIDYLGNMTMFQYYLDIPNLDAPYWTMIVEMLFYIFILFLFQFRLLQFDLYICALITVGAFVLSNFYWNELGEALFKAVPLFEFFPLFFVGIIFYKMQIEETKTVAHYFLITGCILAQILMFDHAGGSRSFITRGEYSFMLTIFVGLFLLFLNQKLDFLILRPFLFLGKISFALYLTHQYIILGHVLPFLVNRLQLNFWISAIGICLPIALLVAAAITYFIEIPFSLKMRRKLHGVFGKVGAIS